MPEAHVSPVVSAIIPTVGRESLRRSVESALGQSIRCEVIVVLDRPENRSRVIDLLDGLTYRLEVTNSQGAPYARNKGVSKAKGFYVAFLDDDDYWLSEKCETQIKEVAFLGNQKVFAVCQTNFVSGSGRVRKSTPIAFNPRAEQFGDYLLSRKRIRHGSTFFSTSGLLMPRALALENPWDIQLKKHQDWDLFIRLMSIRDIHVAQISGALVNIQQASQGSISKYVSAELSLQFLKKHEQNISKRTLSDFLFVHVYLDLIDRAFRQEKFIKTPPVMAIPHFGAFVRFLFGLALLVHTKLTKGPGS